MGHNLLIAFKFFQNYTQFSLLLNIFATLEISSLLKSPIPL